MNTTALRWILMAVALTASPLSAAQADLLSQVLARGVLRCGVTESGPGFSYVDAHGERAGMEVDNCKTVSAALFGAIKVQYVIVSPQTVFTMVQSGGIDLFAGGATWSFLRDVTLGVDFTGVYFYDGQGFMVRRASKIARVAELAGATICITQGTTLEQNLADYFLAHDMKYDVVTFANAEMAMQAYRTNRCDALSMQRAALAARRAAMPDPDAHLILTEMISSEPQAAVVRQGDARWRDLVLWAFNVRVAAEEMGIDQANVDDMWARSGREEVKRLLGVRGNFGKTLGLSNDWAYNVVKLCGNYADMWQRNFVPIGLERGANALWRDGGLMTALPFR